MTVTIRQQYVKNPGDIYTGVNPVDWITVHETGNQNEGADAQAHANYQSKTAYDYNSWHAQADDKEVIESYPDEAMCWHAGDGRGDGNTASIAIEICQNRDGDFKKAVSNAAYWVAVKMKKHGVPLSRVVQHNYWSGKNCPQFLRADSKGIDWADFKNMVQAFLNEMDGDLVEKPVTKPEDKHKYLPLKVDGDEGPWTIYEEQVALWETGDYKGKLDGKRGPMTRTAEQRLLKRKGYYRGRLDGDFAYWSTLAEQEFLYDLKDKDGRLYLRSIDGKRGPWTIKGVQRALNAGFIK